MSDGRLTDAELEAIRARARASAEGYSGGEPPAMRHVRAHRDRAALLSALDSALADLAAAEGALADLCSPQSGEANAAYLRGVEDGVRRSVGWLRKRAAWLAKRALPLTAKHFADAAGDLEEEPALALESPPAPRPRRRSDR